MVVFPNIKINLGLNVIRKRPDGYHDIATVMIGVDWCDVLEVVPSKHPTDRLFVSGISIECSPDKNLVIKALNSVRRFCPDAVPSVDIYLHKNVPDGAGLGGGSSDAAFMIKILNEMFELGLSLEQMAEIAVQVGSDCPFFIYNRPMFATGRGELLSEIVGLDDVLKSFKVVVVKPATVAISTAKAYAGICPKLPQRMPNDILLLPVEQWQNELINDFESSIFLINSSPAHIKERLYALGATYASMSGSGSAVYGLFKTDDLEGIDFSSIFSDCIVHVGDFVHE